MCAKISRWAEGRARSPPARCVERVLEPPSTRVASRTAGRKPMSRRRRLRYGTPTRGAGVDMPQVPIGARSHFEGGRSCIVASVEQSEIRTVRELLPDPRRFGHTPPRTTTRSARSPPDALRRNDRGRSPPAKKVVGRDDCGPLTGELPRPRRLPQPRRAIDGHDGGRDAPLALVAAA